MKRQDLFNGSSSPFFFDGIFPVVRNGMEAWGQGGMEAWRQGGREAGNNGTLEHWSGKRSAV